ncbi:30S ribosomal protein S10 [Halorubrum sp. DTA98]|uniref:30S ribosomal protein S10 n=1 Tax=Halorubrum sp. DTA98 TaxID=3402163 RepID=UPI003AADD885
MTFVTKLTFQSGDHDVLTETVGDLKSTIERKGAECKGPHADPSETVRVPLYKRLRTGEEFAPWSYTVYKRSMEIHGSDDIARAVVGRDFPDSIHVEVEVDRKKPLGHRRDS